MEKEIKALIVRPERKPEEITLENTLETFQAIVDGYIETFATREMYKDDVTIICNEEGKLMGLPFNRAIDIDGHFDVLAGDLIICGTNYDEFTSLTEEQVNKYKTMFKDYLIKE